MGTHSGAAWVRTHSGAAYTHTALTESGQPGTLHRDIREGSPADAPLRSQVSRNACKDTDCPSSPPGWAPGAEAEAVGGKALDLPQVWGQEAHKAVADGISSKASAFLALRMATDFAQERDPNLSSEGRGARERGQV